MIKEFWVLLKKELSEQAKTGRLFIIAFVFIFFAVSSVAIAKATPMLLKSFSAPGLTIKLPEPSYKDAVDQFMKNNSQLVIFILIFIMAGVVSEEKSKRTLELLITKPVNRAMVVFSKFKAYFITISAVFISSAIIFYLYTLSAFGYFNAGNFAIITLISLLFILNLVSATIFGSTVSKNTLSAAGIGFGFLILSFLTYSLVPKYQKFFPNYIFSDYKNILANGWNNDLWYPVFISLVLILLFVGTSVYLFSKQEIER